MRRIRRGFVLLALLTTALSASSASADSVGSEGRVIRLRVNGSGSDDHGKFRGSVDIKAKGKNGKVTQYKWGGSTCPAKDLTEDQVEALITALHGRKTTRVIPRYKAGQGGAKCIVAFDIKRPKTEID